MISKVVQKAYFLISEQENLKMDSSHLRDLVAKFLSGRMSSDDFSKEIEEAEENKEKNLFCINDSKSQECFLFFKESCNSKPFYKELTKFLFDSSYKIENEVQLLDLAKSFSSFLTHVLIQSQKQEGAYEILDATSIALQLHLFLLGSLTLEELKNWVLEKYALVFNSN